MATKLLGLVLFRTNHEVFTCIGVNRAGVKYRECFSVCRRFLSFSNDKSRHHEKEYIGISTNYRNVWITAVAGLSVGFGIGYIIKNNAAINDSVIPIINAAKPTDIGSELRSKFNFIADVVEIVAPSTVYIEIKDLRR